VAFSKDCIKSTFLGLLVSGSRTGKPVFGSFTITFKFGILPNAMFSFANITRKKLD